MSRDAFRFFTGLAGGILAVMGALMLLPTPEPDPAAPSPAVEMAEDASESADEPREDAPETDVPETDARDCDERDEDGRNAVDRDRVECQDAAGDGPEKPEKPEKPEGTESPMAETEP